MGIRIALGAQAGDVRALVVRRGMLLAGMGIATGLLAALGLTRTLVSLLFGIQPTDLATYTAVSLLLAAIAFVACWIPARRATRVDPVVALRYE